MGTTDFCNRFYFRIHHSGLSVKDYIEGFRAAGNKAFNNLKLVIVCIRAVMIR